MDLQAVRTHLTPLLDTLGVDWRQHGIEITPVHAGMSASSFFIDVGAEAYVLRIQLRERLPGHWSQLVRLSELAASVGVAPPIHAVDHGRRWLLSQRIAEVPLAAAMGAPGRALPLLRQLGRFVGKIHGIALPEALEARSVEARTRALFALLEERGPVPRPAQEAMDHFCGLDQPERPALAAVFCHHDLNPSNLLFDDSDLWCIDWETGGAGDAFGDLATLVNFMLLGQEAVGALMEGYFAERGFEIERWEERLFSARLLAYLCYGTSFLELVEGDLEVGGREEKGSLADCYQAMGEGRLDSATDAGRRALAGAMFRGYGELALL